MNAARHELHQRPKPTHAFWPASRRPEPPTATKPPQSDEKKDDEHVDEPGYGHGV